jgi:hypothetical protein
VFDAVVDHYALVYMVTRMSGSLQNQRLLRLCLDLQNFTFRVVHRKGKDNWDADAISRLMQIDEVVRVNTIDGLRTDTSTLTEEERHHLLRVGIKARFGAKESRPEYQVLLERMAQVIETQDTVHAGEGGSTGGTNRTSAGRTHPLDLYHMHDANPRHTGAWGSSGW